MAKRWEVNWTRVPLRPGTVFGWQVGVGIYKTTRTASVRVGFGPWAVDIHYNFAHGSQMVTPETAAYVTHINDEAIADMTMPRMREHIKALVKELTNARASR